MKGEMQKRKDQERRYVGPKKTPMVAVGERSLANLVSSVFCFKVFSFLHHNVLLSKQKVFVGLYCLKQNKKLSLDTLIPESIGH